MPALSLSRTNKTSGDGSRKAVGPRVPVAPSIEPAAKKSKGSLSKVPLSVFEEVATDMLTKAVCEGTFENPKEPPVTLPRSEPGLVEAINPDNCTKTCGTDDEAQELFAEIGARSREAFMQIAFSSGCDVAWNDGYIDTTDAAQTWNQRGLPIVHWPDNTQAMRFWRPSDEASPLADGTTPTRCPAARSNERWHAAKSLAGLLRHGATDVGLHMDRGGWVQIEEVLQFCQTSTRYRPLWEYRPNMAWICGVAASDFKGRSSSP